ncbi:MAG: hypothetical protein ACLQAT_27955 [Candidatus Binataceae bacterium]
MVTVVTMIYHIYRSASEDSFTTAQLKRIFEAVRSTLPSGGE